MPYIANDRRAKLESVARLSEFVQSLSRVEQLGSGDLNYIFSTIINAVWRDNKSYGTGNNIIGMLDCVKTEFYRRILTPYEDDKIKKNGDVYNG